MIPLWSQGPLTLTMAKGKTRGETRQTTQQMEGTQILRPLRIDVWIRTQTALSVLSVHSLLSRQGGGILVSNLGCFQDDLQCQGLSCCTPLPFNSNSFSSKMTRANSHPQKAAIAPAINCWTSVLRYQPSVSLHFRGGTRLYISPTESARHWFVPRDRYKLLWDERGRLEGGREEENNKLPLQAHYALQLCGTEGLEDELRTMCCSQINPQAESR